MLPLSATVQTAYAELLDQLLALEARRSIGHVPGTFVTKEVKGRTYYYFQCSLPGGGTKQVYVGPRSDELMRVVERFEIERRDHEAERDGIVALAAVVRTGGGVTDAPSARVIAALAAAGVFKLGGVLVGTHAYVVLGNVLGVRWQGTHSRTEDVDIATPRALEVAIGDVQASVPAALDALEMGFAPVPGFSPRDPSTSFKVRGRGLRVDLVTPARGAMTGPVRIERFDAAAAPLRFLDYLLEDVQPAAVVDGGGILVNVPHPARFAVHKLIVAQDRPAAFETKARKDLAQVTELIDALDTARPGEIDEAWKRARIRGRGWQRALRRGAAMLERAHPTHHERLRPLL
jgi:hypothetical protein